VGRVLVDARFLFLGVLANVFSVFSLFIVILSGSTDHIVAITLMSTPLIASIALTIVGIRKKGRVSANAAGLVTIGNYPVWGFGFMYTIGSLVDYGDNLDKCQDYSAGVTSALYNCQQIPYSLFLIGFFIATLCLAFVSTFAGVFFLRKTSKVE
jgi:hypothetical protein